MVKSGNIISAVVMVLAIAGAVCADLMPISESEAGRMVGAHVFGPGQVQKASLLSLSGTQEFTSEIAVVDLAAEAAESDSRRAAEEPGIEILADGFNSLDLCLYGLLGLGIVRSGHWVKRPSLGFIPEWYHNGGPHQVGHSYAVGPDAVCPTTVCFIQAHSAGGDSVPRCDVGTIVSLCGRSQVAANASASRGPPDHIPESQAS